MTSVSVFIDMAELRAKLIGDGYWDVATVPQSGNVIVSAEEDRPDEVAGAMRRLLSDEFGIEVACVVRTANQVRGVVVAGSHASRCRCGARLRFGRRSSWLPSH